MSFLLFIKYSCKPNYPVVSWAGAIFCYEVQDIHRYNYDPSTYCNVTLRTSGAMHARAEGCTFYDQDVQIEVLGAAKASECTIKHNQIIHSCNGEY